MNPENQSYRVAINDKGKSVTKLGYNSQGVEMVFQSVDGSPIAKNGFCPVTIFCRDQMDLFEKSYWCGREGDCLKMYLNEIYKSVFHIRVLDLEEEGDQNNSDS